jgi:hypothetical protein
MSSHILRYDRMPIPPIEAHTTYFDAGNVRIGVEYRLLNDELVAEVRKTLEAAGGPDQGQIENLNDRGVSLHVFAGPKGGQLERLRFDCFLEDPHYHYVSWKDKSNEVLHVDPVADGDPLNWALERIRTRLPEMLTRAGGADVARDVDMKAVAAIMPKVESHAQRVRMTENK